MKNASSTETLDARLSARLQKQDYSLYVVSNRPTLVEGLRQSLSPLQVNHVDGTGSPSFSKLVNTCITSSPTEYVIVCGDKARPTAGDVARMLLNLDDGFALVAPYRFGFFGFPKETVRKIGVFDERFVGGGCEDTDFVFRLVEADLGIYMSEEIEYLKMPSTWKQTRTTWFYLSKWRQLGGDTPTAAVRLLPEWRGPYDLGPSQPRKFKRFSDSIFRVEYYVFPHTKIIPLDTRVLPALYLAARGFARGVIGPLKCRVSESKIFRAVSDSIRGKVT